MIRQLGRFDFDQKYLTANQRKQGRLYTGRAYGDDGACWHIAWRIGSWHFLLPEVVGMAASGTLCPYAVFSGAVRHDTV